MTVICKFICACNITLSSRTSSFREKRGRVNLPYTENRDMVKYWFLCPTLSTFKCNRRNSSFRHESDYTRYIGSINLVKESTDGLPMRHKILPRAVATVFWRSILQMKESRCHKTPSFIRALVTITTSCHNSMNPSVWAPSYTYHSLESAIWAHSLVRTLYSYCYFTQNRYIGTPRPLL